MTRIVSIDRLWKNMARAAYWVARWPGPEGTVTQRRFALTKHGERGAYWKAVQARSQALADFDYALSSNLPTNA